MHGIDVGHRRRRTQRVRDRPLDRHVRARAPARSRVRIVARPETDEPCDRVASPDRDARSPPSRSVRRTPAAAPASVSARSTWPCCTAAHANASSAMAMPSLWLQRDERLERVGEERVRGGEVALLAGEMAEIDRRTRHAHGVAKRPEDVRATLVMPARLGELADGARQIAEMVQRPGLADRVAQLAKERRALRAATTRASATWPCRRSTSARLLSAEAIAARSPSSRQVLTLCSSQ